MSERFTLDGSDALEAYLTQLCDKVRQGVQSLIPAAILEGIALAGGYGRGEGGVLRGEQGDLPYNDLEFFVFIRGQTFLNDRRYGPALHHLGEELSIGTGIEVEMKILSLQKFQGSGTNMFYYDLAMGHRWIVGDDSLFAGCAHHRQAERIPLHEATRLLMNRCTGLLYAKERLSRDAFTADDADFVHRNIAKAQLAMGDVLLAAHGQYHWSCIERGNRLMELNSPVANHQALLTHHAAGIHFKLHPARSSDSRETLRARHREVMSLAQNLWLWLEERRLHQRFESPVDYALARPAKCPEQPRWKNVAVNMRSFGASQLFRREALRYPRERLLRALPLLLWGMTSPPEHAMVSTCLQCDALDFPEAVQAYSRLWQRFN